MRFNEDKTAEQNSRRIAIQRRDVYSFTLNNKLRDECLNREVFRNGKEAQVIVGNWRQEYNNYRPHSSLGYLTPVEFARRYYENKQAEEAIKPGEMAGTLSL